VFIAEGGTLTIDGDGAVAGGSVAGGAGANNGSAFGAGLFVQGSTLSFGAGNYTVSDVIADQNGSGGASASDGFGGTGGQSSIVKSGIGTLTLSAANTYTGGTTVSGGTLAITGSIASGAKVESGATLGGSGTVGGGLIADSGATIAPGVLTPDATLMVDGAASFAAGSTFLVDLSADGPGQYGSVAVTGDANLDGGLALDLAHGFSFAAGDTFDLMAYGGFSGDFSSLSVDGAACLGSQRLDLQRRFLPESGLRQ
jgi:autotransporter-associated beta strand protein